MFRIGYYDAVTFFYNVSTQKGSCLIFVMINMEFRNILQGDSGGKDNILGGDIIGHCEKKSSHELVSNSEWLPI
jgi:hypothetical protein